MFTWFPALNDKIVVLEYTREPLTVLLKSYHTLNFQYANIQLSFTQMNINELNFTLI